MKQLENKVAVVTGAASGIGRELAVQLADMGCRLALSDINEKGLNETVAMLDLTPDSAKAFFVDSSDLAAVDQFAVDVVESFDHVDIVINNAGIASKGSIEETPLSVFERVINVNMWGVVHGCRAFLPYLRQRPEASLVNIASIYSMISQPLNGPYNMSKYAVYGLNETLMLELKDTPVHVLSVHPGGIKTNIANSALDIDEESRDRFNKLLRTTAASAASQIIQGIRKNRSQIYIGSDAKTFQAIKRLSPRLARRITHRMFKAVVQ